MISCTEFIPAYSEMFKFLDQRGGLLDIRHQLLQHLPGALQK